MAFHALQNIDDAFEVTKEFLLPFDSRRWLKLAVVAFFIGGGSGLPSGQYNSGGSTGGPSGGPSGTPGMESLTPPDNILLIVVAAIAVLLVLGILFAAIGAIMEFVFIESLRSGDVRLRKYWSDRWRQGLRLFGFRVVIGLPVFALVVGWLALFLVPVLTGGGSVPASLGVFFLGLPVLFVVFLLYGLVSMFTTVFVVPLMIQADSGVLDAWRRLWPSVKAEWKQYLVYTIVGFILGIAAGLIASVVVALAALALLIPFGIVGGILYLAFSFPSTAGLLSIGILAALFVAALVVIWALAQVPVVTYLRYYALLVLGDIDSSFDVIPERRQTLEASE